VKIDRSCGKNAERNFKRIAMSVERPDRIAVRITEKIPNVNNGKACRAMLVVNREAEAAVDQLVLQY
jgi:hypothetical protein